MTVMLQPLLVTWGLTLRVPIRDGETEFPTLPEHPVPLHTHSRKYLLQAPFGSLALEKPSPLSPTWCSPSWEHEPHCVGMDAVTQGVGEDPSRATPHPRCSRPSYFYLANTALSTSSEETSSICFMLTCAAGLSYLLHFCFTLGVSLMSRKNVCGECADCAATPPKPEHSAPEVRTPSGLCSCEGGC